MNKFIPIDLKSKDSENIAILMNNFVLLAQKVLSLEKELENIKRGEEK